MNQIQKVQQSTFESLRKANQQGQDYWSVRELSRVLGYSEFRHFLPVINRAKKSCENSGQRVTDHFADVLEMVNIGSGAQREIQDVSSCQVYDKMAVVARSPAVGGATKQSQHNAGAYLMRLLHPLGSQ